MSGWYECAHKLFKKRGSSVAEFVQVWSKYSAQEQYEVVVSYLVIYKLHFCEKYCTLYSAIAVTTYFSVWHVILKTYDQSVYTFSIFIDQTNKCIQRYQWMINNPNILMGPSMRNEHSLKYILLEIVYSFLCKMSVWPPPLLESSFLYPTDEITEHADSFCFGGSFGSQEGRCCTEVSYVHIFKWHTHTLRQPNQLLH